MPFSLIDAALLATLVAAALLLVVSLVLLRRARSAHAAVLAEASEDRDRMHAALEGSGISLWDWDIAPDSLWLDANWSVMQGSRAEATRTTMAELLRWVHPSDQARVQASLDDLVAGRAERIDSEHRMRVLDDSWHWIRCRGSVTSRGSAGEALRASGTNGDITPRKRAERSVAESEARFRALSELSSDLYWEQDEHFNLVSWSAPAWVRAREAGLPRPELDAPELTQGDWEAHRDVLEARKPFRDLEIRQVLPDGQQTWLSVGAFPQLDEAGRFAGYRGLARIITARKLAEQRVQESESQLRQLLEFMPTTVVFVDREERVVIHNRAYARAIGRADDPIGGRRLQEVLRADRYEELGPYLRRALAGEAGHYATSRPDPDGPRDVEVLLAPLRGAGGQVEGAIAIGIDVTRLKEADRMKDHFVSVVSHELRTPLTSMRGSLGLLAADVVGDLPAEAKQMVDIALQNSDRLWRLVNDLLDIEKMSAGQLEFRLEDLEWAPVLREALEASGGLVKAFDVTFELQAPAGVHVRGDPDRLAQVLSNLVLNAAKFSPPGGLVTLGANTRDDGFVRTFVRDRGPGIPESFRARIFKPFAQADTGDTRKSVGTGLGLAISREIVERLGGRIGFEDAPGGGTVFWFDLPVAAPSPAEANSSPSSPPAPQAPHPSL